ncbi:MAG: PAS domain S-box protein [Bacteroidia bacterium]|nr:PAS domain S-box protein [Bacteroidia bacterium]
MVSLWQFTDAFMRLAYDMKVAEQWYYIMGMFALIVTPLGVIFIIFYAKWQHIFSQKFIILTQYLPLLFFLGINTVHPGNHAIIQSKQWYWIANPDQQLITKIIYAWVSLQGVFIMTLLAVNIYNNRKEKSKRNQAIILALGFYIPMFGGIISQAIAPILLGLDNIPITAPLFTFFSIFTLISILNHNFLEYSPKHHWDKIVETMNEGLIIVNKENIIMYANSQFVALTGYSQSDLIGFRADLDFMRHHNSEDLNDEESYEKQIINKLGERIWVLVSVTPYLDDNKRCIGFIVIYTNINESKRSEARFKALVENAGDIISLTDSNSLFTYVSPAMEKVIGYSWKDLEGKSIFDIMHPEQAIDSRKNFKFLLENPNILTPRINRFIHKNGQEIWVEGVVINLLDDENVQAIVSNHRDINERKIQEEKIQNFLDVTTDQNSRLQNFAHIVSHNIRSHVVNISGLIEILNHTEKEEDRIHLINMLKTSSDKLTETTDNLNEIVTIQNSINNELTELKLKLEIDKTFSVINSLTKQNKCQLNNHVSEDVTVKAIPAYLESILLNLMTNAVKYRSCERDLIMNISSQETDIFHILHVEDNGIGIDLDLHGNKIFGMYKTFHSNKDSRGLGLFITKTQVEAMDGKIEVESSIGKGTKFIVYFKK